MVAGSLGMAAAAAGAATGAATGAGMAAYCAGAAAALTLRATRIFRSPRSTSISVREVSFRMSASWRTSSASISPPAFSVSSAMSVSPFLWSCCANGSASGAFPNDVERGLDRQRIALRA